MINPAGTINLEPELPEYKRIQRECERKAKSFLTLRLDVQPGMVFKDLNGRDFYIALDGSWRRVKK